MEKETNILLIDPEYTWVNTGGRYSPGRTVDILIDLSTREIKARLLSFITPNQGSLDDYELEFLEKVEETRARLRPSFVWLRATDIFYERYRRIVDSIKRRASDQRIITGGSLVGQAKVAGLNLFELFSGEIVGSRCDVRESLTNVVADVSGIQDMVDEARQKGRKFNAPVLSSVGCPKNPPCEFCDSSQNPRFSMVKYSNVERTIGALSSLDPSGFVFLDNSFAVRKNLERLQNITSDKFCVAPKSAMVNMEHLTEENLTLLDNLNIKTVLIGMERIPELVSKYYQQRLGRDGVREILQRIKRHGINVIGSFIVGWRGQTFVEAYRDWEYAKGLFEAGLITSFSIHNMNNLKLGRMEDLVVKGSLDVPLTRVLAVWEKISELFNWTTAVQGESVPILLLGGLSVEDFPDLPYSDSNMTVREVAYIVSLYLEKNGNKFSTAYDFEEMLL